jgi:hypothetical protein
MKNVKTFAQLNELGPWFASKDKWGDINRPSYQKALAEYEEYKNSLKDDIIKIVNNNNPESAANDIILKLEELELISPPEKPYGVK